MNIHFDNTQLLAQLEQATLVKVAVGSHLYGLNTDKSDVDILHIHAKSKNLDQSFLWEHHQLQFKQQNTDLIFTDLFIFIRNLLSGDSTINFEVLHTKELADSDLKFLSDNKKQFYNYNILKSYLGLAKRDLKQCFSETNHYLNTKKLSHAYRSIITAEAILAGNYDNHLSHYQVDFNIIKDLKFNNYTNGQTLITELEAKCGLLRDKINKMLEQKQLVRCLRLEFMQELDLWLQDFSGTNTYIAKQNQLVMDKQIYYQVLEEGLQY
jgi:predicted nucleotidyltransferase